MCHKSHFRSVPAITAGWNGPFSPSFPSCSMLLALFPQCVCLSKREVVSLPCCTVMAPINIVRFAHKNSRICCDPDPFENFDPCFVVGSNIFVCDMVQL
ncbi:hypothetical protein PILCRDRAFT_257663 [Piloderma croceum F 1598]|uniref:Uncharacterized protein n=1 Tax=Piloderma croceum (strain F 1598) TaxID=765440 RepID=A0A0C3FVH9_PILCF|nr:hypothetical protein PILCRDRAFT_257663 [Piloderma croceum F 1598]